MIEFYGKVEAAARGWGLQRIIECRPRVRQHKHCYDLIQSGIKWHWEISLLWHSMVWLKKNYFLPCQNFAQKRWTGFVRFSRIRSGLRNFQPASRTQCTYKAAVTHVIYMTWQPVNDPAKGMYICTHVANVSWRTELIGGIFVGRFVKCAYTCVHMYIEMYVLIVRNMIHQSYLHTFIQTYLK
jgi:hypothetical protein